MCSSSKRTNLQSDDPHPDPWRSCCPPFFLLRDTPWQAGQKTFASLESFVGLFIRYSCISRFFPQCQGHRIRVSEPKHIRKYYLFGLLLWGYPGGSDSKESTSKAGDSGLIPELGRSPEEGNGNPLQYSCLESPMSRGAWWDAVHGVAESDMTE